MKQKRRQRNKPYLPHPVTKKLLTPHQVAQTMDVDVKIIYRRINAGDTGERLWRTVRKHRKRGAVFLSRPDTDQLYTPAEAARIIGVQRATIYNRLAAGDTGEKLWRPRYVEDKIPFENAELPDTIDEARLAILYTIPTPTKFDEIYGGK